MAKYTGQKPDFEGQCEAAISNGTRRCTKHALLGGNVCQTHGGGAPQVQRMNKIRLAELVSPAIKKLGQLIRAPKNDKHISAAVQRAAAVDALNLNGYKAKDEVVVVQAFDPTKFSAMSDDEIAQFIALGRKLTAATDARDADSANPGTG